ncbi:hypothetical protein GGTG_13258 [Gaeumannomyces tritici R3-111a-1]|uniref:Uncharacterized protein n=1 Tax=Gaeumannomyces tritici (strain R3-111a-1) TaxID=644352 RepID=J3PID0_GAET3|nr:hypothetical protein GGTG_13258 [Gaeumannomyces tritici R3-111a-1]EJT69149.1 hypothetical protein GGTG_13258 [Gaeumannomyces tritici R3-111a-1]
MGGAGMTFCKASVFTALVGGGWPVWFLMCKDSIEDLFDETAEVRVPRAGAVRGIKPRHADVASMVGSRASSDISTERGCRFNGVGGQRDSKLLSHHEPKFVEAKAGRQVGSSQFPVRKRVFVLVE